MALQATRTIGTGDGWDVTDSGIYVPDSGLGRNRTGIGAKTGYLDC
jgi:hypothetical protein